ncbi:MAG: L,D-transpeptidase family protein [Magnetococcales bacterium]|nr:L,D-transpeptidase family protein [Magnetococcales bacterium]
MTTQPIKCLLWRNALLLAVAALPACMPAPTGRAPVDLYPPTEMSVTLEHPASPPPPQFRENELAKQPGEVVRTVRIYHHAVRTRMAAAFESAGLPFPPPRLALLAFKQERRLELWGAEPGKSPRWIKNYPFTAFSGELGPKRKQGDRQIPEGIYRITFLNPESSYHLSMKLDYPNEYDRAMAIADRRKDLGGDIFIHGDSYSVGCIALGDRAIEELFVLTALSGQENIQVIISPYDLRRHKEIEPVARVPWTRELYARIQDSLLSFPGAR